MEFYIVELFGGGNIEISVGEYQSLLGKTGLVFLKISGQTINTSAIKRITNKKTFLLDKLEEKKKTQKEGVLHDGTRVIKHFGSWYLINGEYDERGNPLSRVFHEWYPEAAVDCVPTELEYKMKYQSLPNNEERKKAILGDSGI